MKSSETPWWSSSKRWSFKRGVSPYDDGFSNYFARKEAKKKLDEATPAEVEHHVREQVKKCEQEIKRLEGCIARQKALVDQWKSLLPKQAK